MLSRITDMILAWLKSLGISATIIMPFDGLRQLHYASAIVIIIWPFRPQSFFFFQHVIMSFDSKWRLNYKLMNTFPNSAVFAHDPPVRMSSVYCSMWPWHSYGDSCYRKRVIIKLDLGGMLMTNATSKRRWCPQLTRSATYEGDGYETFVVCYF